MIVADLWNVILSYVSTPDLSVPCFVSVTLRDLAQRERLLRRPSNATSDSDLLPVHSVEVAKWWQAEIRHPRRDEILEAAREDQLEVIESFGWSSQHPVSHCRWNWFDIFCAATSRGRKKTMRACLEREEAKRFEDITDGPLMLVKCVASYGKGENLNILEWLLHEREIEGLPLAPSYPHEELDRLMRHIGKSAAFGGHKHILQWWKTRTHITQQLGTSIYNEAICGGNMETIKWLEDNGIPNTFHTSPPSHRYVTFSPDTDLRLIKWIADHGVPWEDLTYTAFQSGVYEIFKFCIDHGGEMEENILNWDRIPEDTRVTFEMIYHLQIHSNLLPDRTLFKGRQRTIFSAAGLTLVGRDHQ
ncbi:hypothetical protein PROFUN_03628 [Planoprotostelium fungivorum]|uniref:Uncharacterized protein n=1 Tax=Planoprotostelium fungivorum TaxID=1890364 RepID=A0A2P6NSH6_9EUKA|nr:hypothetical protein PROFUN_03628 [Planoprotostelium fungivorum]